MSSEIYELMKRSDEAHVVEKAHRRPRFVEDCVREMIRGVIDAFPQLDDAAFVSARQVNLETIHQHNVVAERFGTLGEIRDELNHGIPQALHTTRQRLARRGPVDPQKTRDKMRAVVLERQGEPLKPTTLPDPRPAEGQLLLKVGACAVCRTDLHLRDHEIEATKLPVVLGHQIVGRTEDGRRVGVPWLGWTDGTCQYCTIDRENLCLNARFTGRDIDGGYAELTVADERYCLDLPDELDDEQAAPLLCGGLIGYRALRLAGDAHPAWAVRVRLGCAHDLPGGRPPGSRGLRVHATERRPNPGVRKARRAPSGRAAATRARRSCSTRRSSSPPPASSSPRR